MRVGHAGVRAPLGESITQAEQAGAVAMLRLALECQQAQFDAQRVVRRRQHRARQQGVPRGTVLGGDQAQWRWRRHFAGGADLGECGQSGGGGTEDTAGSIHRAGGDFGADQTAVRAIARSAGGRIGIAAQAHRAPRAEHEDLVTATLHVGQRAQRARRGVDHAAAIGRASAQTVARGQP